jgi:hypothetical protein
MLKSLLDTLQFMKDYPILTIEKCQESVSYVKKFTSDTLQFMKDYPIPTIEKCQSNKILNQNHASYVKKFT